MPQTHRRRTTKIARPVSAPLDRFFEKELEGEQAPSFDTMKALFWKAGQIHAITPWESFSEEDLIAFDDTSSGERCYCSVMGQLGEAFVVQVFIGNASLRQFEKAHEGGISYMD